MSSRGSKKKQLNKNAAPITLELQAKMIQVCSFIGNELKLQGITANADGFTFKEYFIKYWDILKKSKYKEELEGWLFKQKESLLKLN